MPEAKKMYLSVDADQIKVRELLGKDYLELSMRTVSSACPNRNGSWFTEEAQRKALPTYDNKPILGYFENDDFVTHNGTWRKDSETNLVYWDTLGDQGERILGVIRSEDKKDVVFDEATQLYWTEITCVLWTQYSYQQVKRLLKDALKSKSEGGLAKNISVEVDITDYEDIVINGQKIMKIKNYNLSGVTILGSRNGRKVEPGIAGAGLSVLNFEADNRYSAQRQSVMAAYAALDQKENGMEQEKKNPEVAPVAGKPKTVEQEANKNSEEAKTVEPETKKEQEEAKTAEPTEQTAQEAEKPTESEVKKEQEEAKTTEPETKKEHEEAAEDPEGEEKKVDPVCDLAWMIGDKHFEVDNLAKCIDHYEKSEGVKGKDLILVTLRRMKATAEAEVKDLGELLAKVTADDYQDDPDAVAYEENLCKYADCKDLYGKYVKACDDCKQYEDECKLSKEQCEKTQKECDTFKAECEAHKDYDELKKANEEYEHREFVRSAHELLSQAKDKIPAEEFAALTKKCESGEITDFEALKAKVVDAVGLATLSKGTTSVYSAPLPTMGQFPLKNEDKSAEDPFTYFGYKKKTR